ncbi:RecF/RecN/SMC protein [Laetiporus sulphureus 93-53]|uniref:Structural maintenance of chromosomes protein n=1 Tax=Laetiporus sulphureus 93-53 TaxID=1314785 RepID=A0A165FD81_9APHY|nr:RecF/RecN/SMC protein [Laetiporus sulphureus 93-53]KZT08792.1 RecF/RecN/SMC protein [Laetiporus sulphureus 93-53]
MKVKKERGVKTVVKQEKQVAQKSPEPVELHVGEEPAEEVVKGRDNQEVIETSDAEETNEVLTAVLDSKEAVKEQQEEEYSLLGPSKSPTPRPQTVPAAPEEPQGPKARLVIHKMALINFKSYAGRQEIGPFHKSFSAIVGPNGSGKSNTIDALLFVFGYRASKMRQGKLSELIHNSARHPDLDECSVEVHFREIIDLPGPDAFEVVPGSQLIVARTAYKNNSSRYTINGRQSNYKEVQTLLKGRGIDLDHNRFLILQGEVESIAQMKPKAASEHEDGLLEYLEDIIGTSQYKEPIEETLVEVERLSEDRMDKLNRLRIVERDRNALEAKKREAEDYLRMKNEHIRALSRLWQYYLWQCFVNEEAYEKAMARLEKELADETERNRDDILHLELLQKHYDERCAAYEEVREAAAAAVKDLAAQEKKVVGLEERKKHANGKTKKLRKSLQEDEHHYAEAKRAIEDNSAKMDREKAKVEELETSLAEEEKALERIRDSLKDKTQVFHDQIEVKQKELQPWTVKINQKQAEIDLATSERDMLAKKAEAAKAASQEAREALEKLQAEHSTKMEELKELQATKAGNAKEVKESGRKLAEMQARVQQLRSKASSARQKVDEAKASQAASTSQNKVLDSLTRLKNAGRISGFHGRLGSLGTIPDKYDVAVSTACGALNNLVVDTVEQGQACIEYLRKQNIGRASFMVLEKLSNRGMEKIPTPENVPRLFDLIKPKEARFAPAFFKGLGNTLVANDLEQANRIAFGGQRRWRVVTLAGQLIDSSGTMSGGGNHVSRGGMSSKLQADAVSPDVLRRYEQESEEAARELEACQRQLREVEAELDAISGSGPQLDIAIDKVSLDIRTGSKRISEAEKRYRELKAQTKPDAGDMARIATLEKDIATSTERLEALQAKTSTIEAEIQALEKKILEIGGARLLSQKSTVDGIRLHINLANDEITKAEVAKAKAEKDCVKLKSTIKNNTEALEEVERDLEELNAELKEITDYVDQLREQVEAAQVAVENSKDDLEGLKSELDAKNEGIQEFRQKEMELQQKLNDTKKEAKENDRTIEHWQNEHDKLRLEDVDDEDEDEEVVKAEGGKDIVKPDLEEARKRKEPLHELHVYSADELSAFRKKDLIAETELLDENLKNSRPDLSVLKDYRKREEEFLRRAQDLEEVTKERDAKKAEYDNLRKRRLDEFMAGFSTISLKLKEMYQMITLGGNAELELVDSMDPFSEGIIFSVMPPKKSWKNISNLSGGEKTLSSLALVFALHVYKPTPLYFMDEIDAALDFRNVSIVANYIKDRTKNAQFIIISLRNDMFELSHRLIGIYKTANATRSISIDNQPLNAIPVNAILA